MNYMECFQKSIDFIEEQLTEKITVETLAGIAGFSLIISISYFMCMSECP